MHNLPAAMDEYQVEKGKRMRPERLGLKGARELFKGFDYEH